MYQSFTGSSRRPRQVNLSGRNSNPFAAAAAATTTTTTTVSSPSQGPQQAIQSAHQDRQLRQQQRQQLQAARTLQRTWRGIRSRKRTRDAWRAQWDEAEHGASSSRDLPSTTPYTSPAESLAQLDLLLLFFRPAQSPPDFDRLIRYADRLRHTQPFLPRPDQTWELAYLRLAKACLHGLTLLMQPSAWNSASTSVSISPQTDPILQTLAFIATQVPASIARLSCEYYAVLAPLSPQSSSSSSSSDAFLAAVQAPLSSSLLASYQGFVASFLTRPHHLATLQRLLDTLDTRLLTQAASDVTIQSPLNHSARIWLLGQYIYLVHAPASHSHPFNVVPHIPTLARLLASLTEHVNPDAPLLAIDNIHYEKEFVSRKHGRIPLNQFLHTQLQHLVADDGIRSLLARPGTASDAQASSDTQLLAGYALTLLRIFPSRADDIRMSLYLGPSSRTRQDDNIPVIAYFWKAARATRAFELITRDPREAVGLLTNTKFSASQWQPPSAYREQTERNASEWRVMVVFFELYTFVLKVMDDEEFLRGDTGATSRISNNALPLADIKDLTVFLKNLGFAMYYHGQDIQHALTPDAATLTTASLARHFAGAVAPVESSTEPKSEPSAVAGIVGMNLDYFKSLVTGLLRALYERDSRRQFLPKGHWLMTSPFDMSNFIQSVVVEEERRSQLQRQDDEDGGDDDSDVETDQYTSHMSTNRYRRDARSQRKASRKRYLQAIAPRLEILQNMPFLIPFETRVEIFREFVRLDKAKRRGGSEDPDLWRTVVGFRHAGGENELARHHAVVRRKHELDDAFHSFYQLGPALKEPIQITFKDEFDIVEAGIDGGGVTKEFLTSVTSQAFDPTLTFFKENPQHLLYPSPTRVEELKDEQSRLGHPPGSAEYNAALLDLIQKYEFLGRVVGKCLYEGILIDMEFAGFFLTQWSLFKAGTEGQSAYRPTINDLRDLDEVLYRGLLTLKYYPGNVEEDMGLNFTVTDEITLSDGRTRTIETELMPGGRDQPVTNENRLLYISRMARWRLVGQSYVQTRNFLKGLASIIEPGWLSMFNQSELQTLIGGAASSIDVADLRRNTQYGGVYQIGDDHQEHPSIKMFWQVMETMSDEDRRKVLKFVTSTPRAPLLGFGSLNPRFSIRDSGGDESRFPTTSTCVNLLKLPRYKSLGVLREKLLYAVNSGAGFDLS